MHVMIGLARGDRGADTGSPWLGRGQVTDPKAHLCLSSEYVVPHPFEQGGLNPWHPSPYPGHMAEDMGPPAPCVVFLRQGLFSEECPLALPAETALPCEPQC